MSKADKPAGYAFAPARNGRILAHTVDQIPMLINVEEDGVTSSSNFSTPARPTRGKQAHF